MFVDDVAEYLGTQIPELTYNVDGGGNVFVDWIADEPAQAVGVYSLPGLEADSGLPYDPVEFQIIVRGDAGSAVAASWAQKVYSQLHGLAAVTMAGSGTYVVFVICQQSSPNRIGDDDNGRPRYSLDFRAEILNPTAHRS